MSIIQEALKKAESEIKPLASGPGPEAGSAKKIEETKIGTSVKPVVLKKSGKGFKLNKNFLTVVFLILAAFALLRVWQFLSGIVGRSNKASLQDVSYRPIVKGETKDAAASDDGNRIYASGGILSTAGRPDLALNGIMYLEEGPRAIINNVIVKQGDSVGGAVITNINRQNVILEYKDVEITLNLK